MECNKEEAIRAKEMAETKMQNKDFSGAKKVALKAQNLYPNLENIAQLLMVCDVHLSAESKTYGDEKNWYDVLKIESTADDISIKKQYRKFALLLHPDKNKFAGASDAFKLIGEAQRVLLDHEKRAFYDSKIKNCRPNRGPPHQEGSNQSNNKSQPWAQNPFGKTNSPFTSSNPQQQQPPKEPYGTFWTMCPYCSVKYQYYRDVLSRTLWCNRCKKPFTGLEIKDNATASHTPFTQPNSRASNPATYGNVGSRMNAEPQTQESVAKRGTSKVGRESKAESKSSAKLNGKRKKRIDESSESESCDFGSRSEPEEDVTEENGDVKVKKHFTSFGENLRRSTRSKTNASYKEKLGDDDLGSSLRKSKPSGSYSTKEEPDLEKMTPPKSKFKGSSKPVKEDNLNKVKPKESKKGNDGSRPIKNGEKRRVEAKDGVLPDSSPAATNPEIYVCTDPEFSDFDKVRREDCFAAGQIWAVYDTVDTMPRFYARISRIISTSAFKLRITWLEANPDNEDERKWADAGLPVSCGGLRKGNTETTNDRLMFSHPVDWGKGSKRDTYKIYPRKGETWALFRNWDMNWHSDPGTKRKYEFEFVEILSDYCEDNGVSVANLGKVKGFSCLFCSSARVGVDSFQIPRSQLFRFSHRVPSFRLSGDEADDIPKNSFELDPASFPSKLEEIENPKNVKAEVETIVMSEGDSSGHQVENERKFDSEGNSNSIEEEVNKVPKAAFFNFDGEKTPEKFQPGQVWALCSDEDGLPKYYALIKEIDHQPEFKLHITWLKCSMIHVREQSPVGLFKHSKSETLFDTDIHRFSHLKSVEPTNREQKFAIYPRKGEVWAVYKNWKRRMTRLDMEKCDYDIVEILEEDDTVTLVLMLERVSGFKSVFKRCKKFGAFLVDQITQGELGKVSHQIPAFRLTSEKGGSLKGYWELDPAALPIKNVQTSS